MNTSPADIKFKTATITDREALSVIAQEAEIRGDIHLGSTATKMILEYGLLRRRERQSGPHPGHGAAVV